MYKVSSILYVLIALLCTSCAHTLDQADYASYVNLYIGTGGHGHTHPAATVPHGMIQPGPDTRIDGWDACSGYHYSDSTINGFCHTRLSGTGCADYGDVLLMPTVGRQEVAYLGKASQQTAYASPFSHANEVAEPGYYAVYLDRYHVKAEMTATARAAIHRYTFPQASDAGFVLDLDYSIQNQTNEEMHLEVLSDTELCGSKKSVYWAFDQYIHFYARFSKPFTYRLVTDSVDTADGKRLPQAKALLQFPTAEGEQVMVKVGVSAVDVAGARSNVERELADWDFDGVRCAARQAWNRYLSAIDIETADSDQRTIFYTSLYHTGLLPQLFTDADGRHLGMDLKPHQGNPSQPVYSAFSLWDTFRAYHPLLTIIRPELNDAFLQTLLLKAREGGVLPMWELAGNYTGTMIGYHAASLFADAYAKGSRAFDLKEALQACVRAAEYDTAAIHTPLPVLRCLMPQAKYWKNAVGYVPCDKDGEAVAKALEYAYDDWCIAQLAQAAGDSELSERYRAFAAGYKVYFDPATRFMRGLDSKGCWREPFNPRSSNHRNDDYCEGTAWQWTWFVPHDVEGLVDLMGGRDAFIGKLDSLFTADSALEGEVVSADITGLIGQYAHGNEPSHHITHLYNYVGQPWRTQELVDQVLHTLYANAPDGLSGNEDCGQMSAWYILNAMGFYQVCPGKPIYSIGRPLFDEVTIHLPGGKTFLITTQNNSPTNRYIKRMTLNGRTLQTPFFSHDELMDGGKLQIEMTPTKEEAL